MHCLHCFGLYCCIRRVPSSRSILLYHIYCIPGAYTCIQAAALYSTFSIRGSCDVRYHRIRESRYRTRQLLILRCILLQLIKSYRERRIVGGEPQSFFAFVCLLPSLNTSDLVYCKVSFTSSPSCFAQHLANVSAPDDVDVRCTLTSYTHT